MEVARVAARLRRLPHVLLGYTGADGFPMVVPVGVGAAGEQGIELSGPLPAVGGARA